MEFDSKSTKYGCVTIITSAVLALSGLIFSIYRHDSEDSKKRAKYLSDCEKLSAKYGHHYQTLEGPYSDVTFYAVAFGDEYVGLKILFSTDDQTLRFRCGDLKEVDLPKKETSETPIPYGPFGYDLCDIDPKNSICKGKR